LLLSAVKVFQFMNVEILKSFELHDISHSQIQMRPDSPGQNIQAYFAELLLVSRHRPRCSSSSCHSHINHQSEERCALWRARRRRAPDVSGVILD
jgi:hypothetical protein